MIYTLYSISDQVVIKQHLSSLRLDDSDIVGLDSNLIYLENNEAERPSYDANTEQLEPHSVVDLQSKQYLIDWTVEVSPPKPPNWIGFWNSFLLPENLAFYRRIVSLSLTYNNIDASFSLVKESINTTRVVEALIDARDTFRSQLQSVNADFSSDEIIIWNIICENCHLSEAKI